MRLDVIAGMRLLIIALLAYIPTVTVSGWFTAWVAKRCDDELPESLGFLTLDPFAHMSIFGFALLLVGQLFGHYLTFFRGIPGFGRVIILDPQTINRTWRALLEFFARSFAHFVMLTAALVALSLLPNSTDSLYVSCIDFARFFYTQNILLCGIYCLFGIADSICFFRNITRMFSSRYFIVLIVVLLVLHRPVDELLFFYSEHIFTLLTRLFHA